MSLTWRSRSMTGITRCSSSSAPGVCAPGRVDSPPISIMSAPSAMSLQAVRDGRVSLAVTATVPEGIRGDIQNTHDQAATGCRTGIWQQSNHPAQSAMRKTDWPDRNCCGTSFAGSATGPMLTGRLTDTWLIILARTARHRRRSTRTTTCYPSLPGGAARGQP